MPTTHLAEDLEVQGNLTVLGTLGITGAVTLSSTLGVTGAVTLSSTLGVTGAATLSSTLAVTSTSTFTGLATFSAGLVSTAETVTPDSSEGSGNSITAGVTNVDVAAVTTDANDFIVLPALSGVPVGHTINIACNAGTNFELRTPATSNEKINGVDSDGTQEYLCTDTELVKVTKVSATDGWVATALTALGAVATAVVPD